MNEFIYSVKKSTAEALDIDPAAAAADDSVATDAAYSVSGVSIFDDAEGNIKAVLGEKKSGVVVASAPTAATAAVAVAPAKSATAVASGVAVAAQDVVLGRKGMGGLPLSFV
jgi:hypothetical protein